jgi:F420-dependent methylenetetrahydromethanopterin dehydrogenase
VWQIFGYCLEVGDNFAVNVKKDNEEDMDFYIVICTQKMYSVKKDFIDPWKIEFKIGDVVVVGRY